MNYGLYTAAAGALQSLHRQDVLANNLANVNTVGFKPDLAVAQQRLPERLEDPTVMSNPQHLLERLGGGVNSSPTMTPFKQGGLSQSEQPLDLALNGRGYFVVEGSGPGDQNVRLTRDGRFTRDGNGFLAMATTGRRVLGANGGPIAIDADGELTVAADGTLSQSGRAVATLRVADANDEDVAKAGENLLRLTRGQLGAAPTETQVRQGYVEQSAVDPIMAMNAMIAASKAAQGNLKMMQYHDGIMGQAVNSLGRVN